MRVALLARSSLREKDKVTFTAPQWRPDLAKDPVDLKVNGDADWEYYRYRVYESVIPLRNVLWGTN